MPINAFDLGSGLSFSLFCFFLFYCFMSRLIIGFAASIVPVTNISAVCDTRMVYLAGTCVICGGLVIMTIAISAGA